MKYWKLRVAVGLGVFGFVTALFWAGGFDFDTRGDVMVFWLFGSVLCGGLASTFPFGILED